ncbi:fimbrial protein [Klebsiella pneumoniae subsp. pneumoniae]|nr:fimbrial protein [Klebsiella pneumoniae subsp. pneumoniae]
MSRLSVAIHVEAEPDAIKHQTLVAGDFSATATLEASYP